MLRVVIRAVVNLRCNPVAIFSQKASPKIIPIHHQYHCLSSLPLEKNNSQIQNPIIPKSNLLQNPEILKISENIRPLTKFSLKKGKRKTVKAVLKRFYRLDWGAWIRTKSGRHKKLWKKSESRKRRLREHVLTNGTQSWLLDKMVTKYWRKPKHYVDDPYEPYHKREEFYITRKKPI